jgi:hypothetical protein
MGTCQPALFSQRSADKNPAQEAADSQIHVEEKRSIIADVRRKLAGPSGVVIILLVAASPRAAIPWHC